jgi:hypothetical protein
VPIGRSLGLGPKYLRIEPVERLDLGQVWHGHENEFAVGARDGQTCSGYRGVPFPCPLAWAAATVLGATLD